jgi:hypothetical protein
MNKVVMLVLGLVAGAARRLRGLCTATDSSADT